MNVRAPKRCTNIIKAQYKRSQYYWVRGHHCNRFMLNGTSYLYSSFCLSSSRFFPPYRFAMAFFARAIEWVDVVDNEEFIDSCTSVVVRCQRGIYLICRAQALRLSREVTSCVPLENGTQNIEAIQRICNLCSGPWRTEKPEASWLQKDFMSCLAGISVYRAPCPLRACECF